MVMQVFPHYLGPLEVFHQASQRCVHVLYALPKSIDLFLLLLKLSLEAFDLFLMISHRYHGLNELLSLRL
jgi:hypothetical protein